MGKVKDSKVDFWLTEDGLILIRGWARNTFSKKEIADKMGVTPATLNNWCEKYEEIDVAVKTSKEIVDYQVENAVLKAALGYKTKEIKVTVGKKVINGEMVEMLKETTTREVPPNVNAAIFWLNNRKFDDWKRNRDKVVEIDPDDQQVTITIQRGNKARVDIGDDDISVNGSEIDVDVDENEFDEDVNDSVTYTHKELNEAESNLDEENDENDEWDDYEDDEDEEWE